MPRAKPARTPQRRAIERSRSGPLSTRVSILERLQNTVERRLNEHEERLRSMEALMGDLLRGQGELAKFMADMGEKADRFIDALNTVERLQTQTQERIEALAEHIKSCIVYRKPGDGGSPEDTKPGGAVWTDEERALRRRDILARRESK